MSAELLRLADIVEGLTGPDREINMRIPAALGYVWNGSVPCGRWEKDGQYLPDADFTGSLDAAMSLVPEGFACAVGTMAFKDCNKKPWATYWTPQGEPHSVEAATPALALSAAALRALACDGRPNND